MGYRIVLPGGSCQGQPHTPRGGETFRGGRVPAGPGAGVPVLLLPQLSATGRAAGRGQPRLSAQSEPESGGRTQTQATLGGRAGRSRWGHLPSSSTFFPAGSLERERVETSLRMQDLAGSKAHAQAGAPRGRNGTSLARPGGGGRERDGLGRAPSSGGHATPGRPRPGGTGGDRGRVRSLPKVLPVLVVPCRGAAVARG